MSARERSRSWRPEIQDLRAVGVATVVLFHLWPSFVGGGYVGVDVFFVISGFLITQMLLREAEEFGRVSLVNFYFRRIRRLLPAATLVLFVVAVFAPLLPPPRWHETAVQIAASALYVQNWQLAWLATDYLGSTDLPSPVMHYWSLSIEEQLYLVWPWLIVLCVTTLVSTRKLHAPLALVIGVVTLLSFLISLFLSYTDANYAYFATLARAWEFGLGGLLVLAPQLKSDQLRRLVGYLGLACILTAAFVFSKKTTFPGIAALLPTLGAAMVIVAGNTRGGVEGWMSFRPIQYLGDISYSCYLWHWPLIVFFVTWAERSPALWDGLLIIAVTLALSHVTKVFVEDRFRYGSQAGAIPIGLLGIGVVSIGACLIASAAIWLAAGPAFRPAVAMANTPGARALIDNDPVHGDVMVPSLASVKNDRPEIYAAGCHAQRKVDKAIGCEFGSPDGHFRIALVGDSHAGQWFPALNIVARQRGWRLTVYTKSACPFVPIMLREKERPYEECYRWGQDLLEKLYATRPDLVIVAHSVQKVAYGSSNKADSVRRIALALRELWAVLGKRGIQVVAIRDTPTMPFNVPECLSKNAKCTVSRAAALSDADPIVVAAREEPSVALLDFTDAICGAENCAPIVGNVLVWRDQEHLTATYAASLDGALGTALDEIQRRTAELFGEPTSALPGSPSARWSQGPFALPDGPSGRDRALEESSRGGIAPSRSTTGGGRAGPDST
jgi:peptidoglycan/LPS O-acetylase OafA/YrhL